MGRKKTSAERSADDRSFGFTIRRLEQLEPPATGRVRYRDTRVRGLYLVVSATGAKIFYLYRRVHGRPVQVRIGAFPETELEDARDAAQDMGGTITRGGNPAAERRSAKQQPTLDLLAGEWLEDAKGRKKTWGDDQRQIDKYLKSLKHRRLPTITRAEVRKLHRDLREKHGPYQANRVLALLTSMFNAAEDLIGYRGPNPAAKIKKFAERSRDRFIQADELPRLFAALDEESGTWRDFFLLCLFTGQRRQNVQAMRWEDIDLDAGTWFVPGETTKNNDPLAVALVGPALEILRPRYELDGQTPWVFPARTKTGHISEPKTAWQRVLKRAGIDNLRIHDLRRSLGSWQAGGNASLEIIGRTLGHRSAQATKVYARLQLDPVRAAMEKAVAAMQLAGEPKDSKRLEGPKGA